MKKKALAQIRDWHMLESALQNACDRKICTQPSVSSIAIHLNFVATWISLMALPQVTWDVQQTGYQNCMSIEL